MCRDNQGRQRDQCNQRGMTLPEALATILVFSVIALALLKYLQRLEHTQQTWLDHQQALNLCHQALERYRLRWREESLQLPAGWRLRILQHPRGPYCMNIAAEVCTLTPRCVKLEEWSCTGLYDAHPFTYRG